jgi:hypothetical protein
VRPTAHVLFFMLEGKLEPEPLRKALAELSTKEAQCKLAYGPRKAGARPGAQFVAVEAPAALGSKELSAALRKGCSAADLMACTVFRGKDAGRGGDAEGSGFFGMDLRDFVLGMSGDIRWYDTQPEWRQFYFGPGKIAAKEIADRYQKLFGPVGGGQVGSVAGDELRWTLAEPLDEKAAARAAKAIGKLAGVARCALDPKTRVLELELHLENLKSSGPVLASAQAPGDPAPVRLRFDTVPLFEILDKEQLALAAAPAAGGK